MLAIALAVTHISYSSDTRWGKQESNSHMWLLVFFLEQPQIKDLCYVLLGRHCQEVLLTSILPMSSSDWNPAAGVPACVRVGGGSPGKSESQHVYWHENCQAVRAS